MTFCLLCTSILLIIAVKSVNPLITCIPQKQTSLANNVDPLRTASDQDLHCLLRHYQFSEATKAISLLHPLGHITENSDVHIGRVH